LAQTWSRETPCRSCELIALCEQCPGWAQLESGDPEAPGMIRRLIQSREILFKINVLQKL